MLSISSKFFSMEVAGLDVRVGGDHAARLTGHFHFLECLEKKMVVIKPEILGASSFHFTFYPEAFPLGLVNT